ncbi:hypothetical protein GCM10025872_10570 [Barrientosiimonas endolithica]|uniref:MalQ N-terminal beta-sandwich domain-containing protein n=1 Tax=Barrientosiimonas endolithica TaxID=1535208 RepID=A0ABM8H912_9MICO|nr:hypothetical protein [Barrientosiimonas endolithica]BDZ57400.1 hypothetical protein GCM10025872_10570 [Barrientosiimonas endolithica]
MPSAPSSTLQDLAHAHDIATEYWDWKGNHVKVSDDTLRSVLAALDVPAEGDEQVAQAMARKRDEAWRRTLPPVVVLREGWTPWVAVHVPDGAEISAVVRLEDGTERGSPSPTTRSSRATSTAPGWPRSPSSCPATCRSATTSWSSPARPAAASPAAR